MKAQRRARIKSLIGRYRQKLQRQGAHIIYVGYKTQGGRNTGKPAIICGVKEKKPLNKLKISELIDRRIEGEETDVVQMDEIKAQAYTQRLRPTKCGISIGHFGITAGTLGCIVRYTETGQLMILSNNHVLANSNKASQGDNILQPGPVDGGSTSDKVGELFDFIPINFSGGGGGGGSICPIAGLATDLLNAVAKVFGRKSRVEVSAQATNVVDAALCLPTTQDLVDKEILDIGLPTGAGTVQLGDAVKKTGRTTEHTTGQVIGVDAVVNVSYGPEGVATFTDQIVLGPMSEGGDSGSAILNQSNQVVALLFAGSSSTTIVSPIQYALDGLGVEIAT